MRVLKNLKASTVLWTNTILASVLLMLLFFSLRYVSDVVDYVNLSETVERKDTVISVLVGELRDKDDTISQLRQEIFELNNELERESDM